MKEIIYNYDNLNENEVNRYVKRAKMIVENSKGELLVVYSHNNYYLIGGHVEENESFDECVVREIKEEAGVDIPYKERKPFLTIRYLNRNYPLENINTESIANYYSIKYDLVPNLSKVNLTEEELDGGFQLKYIPKKDILNVLYNSLKTCTKVNVVKDTIDAVEEYLKNN